MALIDFYFKKTFVEVVNLWMILIYFYFKRLVDFDIFFRILIHILLVNLNNYNKFIFIIKYI